MPNDHGSYGVALVLDGWYTDKRDAAEVVTYWRELLEELVEAHAAGRTRREPVR